MRLKVSSAIRIDWVEPLTDGEPLHDAIEGISLALGVAEEFSYWIGKGQWTGIGGTLSDLGDDSEPV
jgi:hypothetical protein